jgi:hypothetical protein
MLGWPRFWEEFQAAWTKAGHRPGAMVEFWLTVGVFVIALAVIFVWWVLELA